VKNFKFRDNKRNSLFLSHTNYISYYTISMATKEELENIKRQVEIRKLLRKEKITGWGDYVGFWSSKIVGAGMSVVGGLEIFDPSFIAAVIPHPEYSLGGGLALFAGKGILNLVIKALKGFEETK